MRRFIRQGRWAVAWAAALAVGAAWAHGHGHDTAAAPATHARHALPALGDAGLMSSFDERKLGDAMARQMWRDPAYLDDPILGDYVDGIWQRLLAAARERGEISPEMQERYAWRVLLGRDGRINAFALPGGYFGVHTALVGVTATRHELASVLAHEMAHVTQRHIPRMLSRQQRQTPLLLASLLLGALAATRDPQAGAAIITGGQAAMLQQQLNYSRDMEREADRIGYGILTQAGFAPQGFVGMFDKLLHASRLDDNGQWPYLRSHPLTTERMADMQQRHQAQAARAAGQGDDAAPDLTALMLAARARLLGRPGPERLQALAEEPQHADFARRPLAQRVPALYAAALARAQLRQWPQAQAQAAALAQALQSAPLDDRARAEALEQARLLQADVALQAGDAAQALALLPAVASGASGASGVSGVSGASGARAALLLRSHALLDSGQPAQAQGPLQCWVAQHPQDAAVWQTLARVHAAQGRMLRALRAEGEVAMAHMDYAGAIDRWRAAQEHVRRHPDGQAALIEASIIDARLRVAQEAQKRLQQDESQSPDNS